MTTMYSKFGFDGDFMGIVTSLFEIWTPAWAPPVPVTFTKGFFFFSLQNYTLSFFLRPVFFFLIFSQGLSSAFDFSTSKDFSMNKELPRLNLVKCAISKNMEIR